MVLLPERLRARCASLRAFVHLALRAASAGSVFLLRDILALVGPEGPRLAVLAGHDTTLMPLLDALDAWDGQWPPFSSMLVIVSARGAVLCHKRRAAQVLQVFEVEGQQMASWVYNGRIVKSHSLAGLRQLVDSLSAASCEVDQ